MVVTRVQILTANGERGLAGGAGAEVPQGGTWEQGYSVRQCAGVRRVVTFYAYSQWAGRPVGAWGCGSPESGAPLPDTCTQAALGTARHPLPQICAFLGVTASPTHSSRPAPGSRRVPRSLSPLGYGSLTSPRAPCTFPVVPCCPALLAIRTPLFVT